MTFRMPLAMLAAVACCAFVKPASATVIGSLDVANCAGGSVSLTATSLTWLPAGALPGTGCITTGAGTGLTYSGGTVDPGVFGNIADVTFGSIPVDQFMIFAPNPGLDFALAGVGPGSANLTCTGLTIGQSCSESAGSPFVLTSLGSSTLVSFLAYGTVEDAGVTSFWSGSFSTQFNMSAATIKSVLNAGGSVSSTYSGTFNVTAPEVVPEPSTVSMLMAGVLLLGVGLKRRKA